MQFPLCILGHTDMRNINDTDSAQKNTCVSLYCGSNDVSYDHIAKILVCQKLWSLTRGKCIEMRRNHQILVKLDLGVREGGHFMRQEKYNFHESRCENLQTMSNIFVKNNEGGVKTCACSHRGPEWAFLAFFGHFQLFLRYCN